MPAHILRLLLLCLALLCTGVPSRAGAAAYTDRGSIDFDTALQYLNPYGTWSKIEGVWAYTPLNHQAPYTNGRWLYTEYGWYWKGSNPHSWLTEHYGYWKRNYDDVWSWYPGATWVSQIIEFRATPTHIGWRSAPVDRDGNFVESPDDRYAKTEEWTFVTREQFANPITPGMAVDYHMVGSMLDDATDCTHAYMAYRPLDRPGPHPADFVALCKDGGMFSPLQTEVFASAGGQPEPKPIAATAPPTTNAAPTSGTAASIMSGGTTDQDPQDPKIDTRQVKYWVTMSLPTYWTPRPTDAKQEQLFIYRPNFFQDEDGIQRRVTLWFDPKTKTSLKDVFAASMASPKAAANGGPSSRAQAATPAVPASRSSNAFASPLSDPYQPSEDAPSPHAATSSTKSSNGVTPAPSGLANATNASPGASK